MFADRVSTRGIDGSVPHIGWTHVLAACDACALRQKVDEKPFLVDAHDVVRAHMGWQSHYARHRVAVLLLE